MTWRSRFIVALAIVLPAPVLAQTVKPENLVGTWAATYKNGETTVHDTLSFSADGKLKRTYMENGKLSAIRVRDFQWSLSSDTLWTDYGTKVKPFSVAQLLEAGRKLTLHGGIADSDSAYTRVGSGKP